MQFQTELPWASVCSRGIEDHSNFLKNLKYSVVSMRMRQCPQVTQHSLRTMDVSFVGLTGLYLQIRGRLLYVCMGLPWWLTGKGSPAIQETWVQFLGQEDPLEREMTTHSSMLAWEMPWTEEPSRPWSIGLQGVGHELMTKPSPAQYVHKLQG